ncbi:MAG: 50S ribosomal protein L23 [Candidatus Nomurabacteria bacterium]|nr:50S ribosomal protein L23 [Candidatus Nomurabacteria bacterium]
MGILNKKKKETDVAPTTESKGDKTAQSLASAGVIVGPRITEKAAVLSENNVYTFDIAVRANKQDVKKAIKAMYGVDAEKVRITRRKPVAIWRKGWGRTKTEKKAYVYLKKGDSITLA